MERLEAVTHKNHTKSSMGTRALHCQGKRAKEGNVSLSIEQAGSESITISPKPIPILRYPHFTLFTLLHSPGLTYSSPEPTFLSPQCPTVDPAKNAFAPDVRKTSDRRTMPSFVSCPRDLGVPRAAHEDAVNGGSASFKARLARDQPGFSIRVSAVQSIPPNREQPPPHPGTWAKAVPRWFS